MVRPTPRKVVIAGGGVGGLELLLQLRRLAGTLVDITLVAPNPVYRERASTVAVPFGGRRGVSCTVSELTARYGVRLHQGWVVRVDAPARVVHLDDGTTLPYDDLVLAVGAVASRPLPEAITLGVVGSGALDDAIRSLDDRESADVALVIPPGPAWPLPAYELALQTATDLHRGDRLGRVVVVTAESRPLAVFGWEVGEQVRTLLADAGVEVRTDVTAWQDPMGTLTLTPSGERFPGFTVVALPRLSGPAIAGLPTTSPGFLRTDESGRVESCPGVLAIGDCTDQPVKHGSLAAQQAHAVATVIARAAGADVTVTPIEPELRAALLTGAGHRLLRARLARSGAPAHVSEERHRWPSTKVDAPLLEKALTHL
jgi:sulfide:quinone oxidoreductase